LVEEICPGRYTIKTANLRNGSVNYEELLIEFVETIGCVSGLRQAPCKLRKHFTV
jgi:predicted metal-binding protein